MRRVVGNVDPIRSQRSRTAQSRRRGGELQGVIGTQPTCLGVWIASITAAPRTPQRSRPPGLSDASPRSYLASAPRCHGCDERQLANSSGLKPPHPRWAVHLRRFRRPRSRARRGILGCPVRDWNHPIAASGVRTSCASSAMNCSWRVRACHIPRARSRASASPIMARPDDVGDFCPPHRDRSPIVLRPKASPSIIRSELLVRQGSRAAARALHGSSRNGGHAALPRVGTKVCTNGFPLTSSRVYPVGARTPA